MRGGALLIVAALVSGCGGSEGYGSSVVVTPFSIESITVSITPSTATLRVGEAVRLTATVAGGPVAASRDVTFAISGDSAVVVEALGNDMGKAIAIAKGNVTVIATSVANPQKSAASAITVTP
jgi:uncharacterized protein YjdB